MREREKCIGARVQNQLSQAGGDRHPAVDEPEARWTTCGSYLSKRLLTKGQPMVLEVQDVVKVRQELLPEDSPNVRREIRQIGEADKEELLIACFHRSKSHFAYPDSTNGRFPGRGLEDELEFGGESEFASQARVHVIALAAGVHKKPVRAISLIKTPSTTGFPPMTFSGMPACEDCATVGEK